MMKTPSWLEDAVFYEIYPQSFYDSNGDGIGDIPGIIEKLDYIQSLGVNAIWLNPCFESPFQDAGYDVSDYYQVASRYGTNEDLRKLFETAKQREIRILLDLVPGHTSINCQWFQESQKHNRNPFTDWYIWTNSVWTWETPGIRTVMGYAERNSSYVTNFFYFQPALNFGFANPDPRFPWQQPVDAPGPKSVRQELKNIMKFWLDLGANGFRVDMAGSLVKNDSGWKETGKLWGEMRDWLDQNYPEAVIISEWGYPSKSITAGFHMDFMLHFNTSGLTSLFRKPYGHGPGSDPYGFSYFDRSGHGNIRQFLDDYLPHYEKSKDYGHIALISGNHDITPRIGFKRNVDDLELCFLFLLTMPGTPFIYYGDEIGMDYLDWLPSKEGGYERTGVRTPMQWDNSPNAGFSTAAAEKLYLPVDERPERPIVLNQEEDGNSLLNRVRRLIQLRKNHDSLKASGNLEILFAEADQPLFIYKRSNRYESIIIAINPSGKSCEALISGTSISNYPTTIYGHQKPFSRHGENWKIFLPAVSASILRE